MHAVCTPANPMTSSDPNKILAAQRLRDGLTRIQAARARSLNDAALHERLLLLKGWQVNRLSTTYADLLADPRYGPPTEFFRNDLYGPKDFSQRDRDVERIYGAMVRILPTGALHAVATALELEALSEELDLELADVLWEKLAAKDGITLEKYAEAYRLTERHAERAEQITLILELGADLDRLVKVPLLYASLKLMRGPARMAGLAALQDFLERGFHAFRHMHGAEAFLQIIGERETRILERIFSRHPAPFALDR